MATFNCIVEYPAENKKFTVILDDQKTPADLIDEFKQQLIRNKSLTIQHYGKILNANITFTKQGVKANDILTINPITDAGGL